MFLGNRPATGNSTDWNEMRKIKKIFGDAGCSKAHNVGLCLQVYIILQADTISVSVQAPSTQADQSDISTIVHIRVFADCGI